MKRPSRGSRRTSSPMLQPIAFYVFSSVMILAALAVVAARNPVHSVLFLILTFFNAAALFVLLGAEFLAMILVVVYVGAVAVLFLFVVMVLELVFLVGLRWQLPVGRAHLSAATPANISNTAAIGQILYTDYIYYFQIAGLVLLVAMIGAIVLTLRHRPGVRRQKIWRQNARTPAMAVEMVDLKPGEGAAP